MQSDLYAVSGDEYHLDENERVVGVLTRKTCKGSQIGYLTFIVCRNTGGAESIKLGVK